MAADSDPVNPERDQERDRVRHADVAARQVGRLDPAAPAPRARSATTPPRGPHRRTAAPAPPPSPIPTWILAEPEHQRDHGRRQQRRARNVKAAPGAGGGILDEDDGPGEAEHRGDRADDEEGVPGSSHQ